MADTGWVTVGTGANNADAGATAWTNPGNITSASDASYAQATSIAKNGAGSQYLHGTNLSLSVPAGATIDGVEALVRRTANNYGNTYDHTIQLIVGGSRSGDNKASATIWPANTSINSATYGGASDLWSLSLSQADVVAANFGLAVRVAASTASAITPRVQYLQIKVHYTEAAGNTGAFFALFNVKDRLREILKPKKRFWLPEPAFARAA